MHGLTEYNANKQVKQYKPSNSISYEIRIGDAWCSTKMRREEHRAFLFDGCIPHAPRHSSPFFDLFRFFAWIYIMSFLLH
jgi:hypothetical protein